MVIVAIERQNVVKQGHKNQLLYSCSLHISVIGYFALSCKKSIFFPYCLQFALIYSLWFPLSASELLKSEDAGHHVSGLAGGQVVRLPGGTLTTLPPHHPGLRRGGRRDAEHAAALTSIMASE